MGSDGQVSFQTLQETLCTVFAETFDLFTT